EPPHPRPRMGAGGGGGVQHARELNVCGVARVAGRSLPPVDPARRPTDLVERTGRPLVERVLLDEDPLLGISAFDLLLGPDQPCHKRLLEPGPGAWPLDMASIVRCASRRLPPRALAMRRNRPIEAGPGAWPLDTARPVNLATRGSLPRSSGTCRNDRYCPPWRGESPRGPARSSRRPEPPPRQSGPGCGSRTGAHPSGRKHTPVGGREALRSS